MKRLESTVELVWWTVLTLLAVSLLLTGKARITAPAKPVAQAQATPTHWLIRRGGGYWLPMEVEDCGAGAEGATYTFPGGESLHVKAVLPTAQNAADTGRQRLAAVIVPSAVVGALTYSNTVVPVPGVSRFETAPCDTLRRWRGLSDLDLKCSSNAFFTGMPPGYKLTTGSAGHFSFRDGRGIDWSSCVTWYMRTNAFEATVSAWDVWFLADDPSKSPEVFK